MNGAVFPLVFASEEFRLLTGLLLGFFFGLALERGGFGNARKLAGQFYLNDMTVFKVMFTAILVAMFGLFGLSAVGLLDLSAIWINLDFLPAQAVGGFILGIGFIMSGLCPGTSVVSAMSGRIDAWVAFLGIFLGIALFVILADLIPGLESLYNMGSGQVSLLPDLLGMPPLLLALAVLAVAVLAFAGAEKLEALFGERRRPVELTPPPRPRAKLTVGVALAGVGVLGLIVSSPPPAPTPLPMASLEPLELAEALIQRTPGVVVLDVRPQASGEEGIPGALRAPGVEEAREVLAGVPAHTTVVVYDEAGELTEAPPSWPEGRDYRFLRGGLEGWRTEVLTPVDPNARGGDREWALTQNQIAAFFTGAAVQISSVSAPPPAMAGGKKKKKKSGGC